MTISSGFTLTGTGCHSSFYQGERGVPGLPGEQGEKGEPGQSVIGPSVSMTY